MENKKPTGGARAGAGRKPLTQGVPTVSLTFKLPSLQKEKLKRLGGAPWLRASIDLAKLPEE